MKEKEIIVILVYFVLFYSTTTTYTGPGWCQMHREREWERVAGCHRHTTHTYSWLKGEFHGCRSEKLFLESATVIMLPSYLSNNTEYRWWGMIHVACLRSGCPFDCDRWRQRRRRRPAPPIIQIQTPFFVACRFFYVSSDFPLCSVI